MIAAQHFQRRQRALRGFVSTGNKHQQKIRVDETITGWWFQPI